MLRRFLFIFSLLLLLMVGFSARAYSNPGKPTGFVNDYASILQASEVATLEAKLTQFSKDTSNEISVVTIASLEGDYIENYANKLFTDWGIGKDKKDNGVLLLISLAEKKMRLEVGYGLEGALPDATCNQIIEKTLKPAFRSDKYGEGINQAIDQIILATKGEYVADPVSENRSIFSGMSFDAIFFLILVAFYALGALWRYLAKSRHWWEGGVLGFVVGVTIVAIFLKTLLAFSAFIIIGFVLFGLLSDYLVSRVLPKPKASRKGGNDIWFFGGGGGSSGGFGGGGFGGFGGGSSGGGGASGSW